MAGTITGGKAAAATNKLKHGEDFYKKIGAEGGKNGKGHAFGHGKVDPAVAGRVGGSISKRKPGVKKEGNLAWQALEDGPFTEGFDMGYPLKGKSPFSKLIDKVRGK